MNRREIETDPFGEANDETFGGTFPTTRDGYKIGSAEGGLVERGRPSSSEPDRAP